MDLTNLTALSAGYKAKKYDPVEVVEEVIARIEAAGEDNVWISRVAEKDLRKRAEQLRAARANGSADTLPLYGIPFAVKDNIDIAGFPTTVGCPEFAYEGRPTAPVVQRLIDAGAILVGKTNMDQFAIGLTGARSPYGTPRNPYGRDYIPGGSSSGSAVAVASGLVTFALGTDTAGSVRIPAGFNNVVGLKPTRGLLSTTGTIPACRSLDCVAILATDIRSSKVVLDAAAAFDPSDPFSRMPDDRQRKNRPVERIGILRSEDREFFGDGEAAAVYESGIERLRALGLSCSAIDFRPFREAAELLYNGAWMAEREVAVGDFIRRKPEAVIPATRVAIQSSSKYSAADGFRSFYRLKELKRDTRDTWEEIDALFVPTAPRIYEVQEAVSDPVGLMQRLSRYTNFVNLLDLCAIAAPSGFTAKGLPVGATFIAPAFQDHALIALNQRFETTTERRSPNRQR